MWCRAILVTIALSCTFDTTVLAHGSTQIKDIICVLILNGLQKEDLDVNTLRKLQRHNVYMDDMNNEVLRKECEMMTTNSNENDDINTPEILNDKKEDQKIKLNDSNLQNIIINYFNNAKTNVPNNNKKETKPSTELPNVESFMNMWSILSKKSQHKLLESTTEINTVPLPITTSSDMLTDDKTMAYMNKLIQNFIAVHKISTTHRPTTEIMDYDLLAQKIHEILAKTSNTLKPSTPSTVDVEKIATDKVNKVINDIHNDSIQFMDKMSLNNPLTYFKPIRENNTNMHFENETVQYDIKRRYINDVSPSNIIANASNESPRYTKIMNNNQVTSISEDIIREISESVKKKVLQDLKLETTLDSLKTISTTKYTLEKPITDKPTTVHVKYQVKEGKKDVTDVLEKFMEMFHQIKASIKINQPLLAKNKFAVGKNRDTVNKSEKKKEHPFTVNIPVIKPIPVNITAVLINPFNPMQHAPILQTAILPNTFVNINPPVQMKSANGKEVQKITQLNIFNTKNNYHTSPITIQTNSYEVPPLGLPAQQSAIYQNIVVTTKHPFEINRHDFRSSSYERNYDENKYKHPPYQRHPRDFYNEFEIGRHERSRQFLNDAYSKEENRFKPIKYKHGRGHSYYNDRNIERFHEKLENADDWPRSSRSQENRNINYDYRPQKLISRHQLPLNNAKQKSRYDDSHFRNFLKTQQKVNDMLEKILASKTNANGPRSVETTV